MNLGRVRYRGQRRLARPAVHRLSQETLDRDQVGGIELETPIGIRKALRESATAAGFLRLAVVLVGVEMASHVFRSTFPALLGVAVAILVEGYLLSYSHAVANGDSSRFAGLAGAQTHIRRGLSLMPIDLLGLLFTAPLALVGASLIGGAMAGDILSRSMSLALFTSVMSIATTAITLPFRAVYILDDNLASALAVRSNLALGWRNRELLTVPVSFAVISAAVHLAAIRTLLALTGAPMFGVDRIPPPSGALALLGDNALAAGLGLATFSVMAAVLQIAAAHLAGQYARRLQGRRDPV